MKTLFGDFAPFLSTKFTKPEVTIEPVECMHRIQMPKLCNRTR